MLGRYMRYWFSKWSVRVLFPTQSALMQSCILEKVLNEVEMVLMKTDGCRK